MLDRADPRVDRLLRRQRHRDMARRPEPERLRPPQRIEEQFGFQRAVGDLDEIDLVAVFQPVERRIDVGLAADLDRAFPERRDPFDLRARGQEPRSEQLAARSEEHTSELQSLMSNSYAVFCLKKKKSNNHKP